MFNEKMYALGSKRSIIREIFEYCKTRAAEIGADAILLAKNVDGIYDSDPKKNPDAKKFDEISYMQVIEKGLSAMDTTAITLCMENKIPIVAFGLNEKDSIMRAVKGEKIGTVIR